jgi:hypothetical protein
MEDAKARENACTPSVAPQIASYLTRLYLPLDDRVLTASPSPENCSWLQANLGKPIQVICRTELLAAIQDRYGASLLQDAVFGLARRFPDLSARTVVTRAQAAVLGLMAMTVLTPLVLRPHQTISFAMAALSGLVIVCTIFRVALALLGHRSKPSIPVSDIALPTYTILVPLYREAQVLPSLVAGLLALDYPGLLAQAPQADSAA